MLRSLSACSALAASRRTPLGEQVVALVEPADDQICEESTLRAYLKEHLAGYKIPRIIEFRRDLPREDSGKIFKRKLREHYWKDTDRNI